MADRSVVIGLFRRLGGQLGVYHQAFAVRKAEIGLYLSNFLQIPWFCREAVEV